ncbi:MAG: hypothetical protein NT118_01040 [Lentisphaerae bacterium]|nr:hypothetical protein [Lentisphaerota bacterium]
MSTLRVFFIAVAVSVLPFVSQDLPAADAQKLADSKPVAKSADKIRMDKPSVASPNKGGTDAFGDKGGLFRKFISELSPEDLEGLKKLNKDNPEAFREEMRKRMDSKRSELEGQNSKASELAGKFRKAGDDNEKAKIKSELRDSVKEEFEKKMEMNSKRLEQAEKQLGEFRAKLDERKKKADEIIDGRVNDLLKDPGMKW